MTHDDMGNNRYQEGPSVRVSSMTEQNELNEVEPSHESESQLQKPSANQGDGDFNS